MKRSARLSVTLAACALALASPTSRDARADTPPGLWGGAADPGARARYALHVRARQILDFESRVELAKFGALDHARALLDQGRAESSPDVRLRFDLGEVYYALDLHAEAVRVLEPATREFEAHPAAPEAIVTLAYAYAKLDRPQQERDTYARYLVHAVDPGARATATLNLAESDMRLGRLRDAVDGYEAALAATLLLPPTSGAHETTALAVWGLAVALDRSGEAFRARKEATRAIGLDPGMAIIGHGRNVFFVPEYERLWYLALGAGAAAEAAQNPHEALEHRRAQELALRTFVAKASAEDRWLGLARVRLRQAEALRKSAEAEARRAPKPDADPTQIFKF